MNMIKKIYTKYVIGNIKEMDDEPDVDKWLTFLEQLPKTNDFVDTSYNKYLCRKYHFSKTKNIVLNVAFFPMAIWSFIRAVGRKDTLPIADGTKLIIERKADLDYNDIVPIELFHKTGKHEEILDSRNKVERIQISFSKESKSLFVKTIRKHPFSFYYLYWIARELTKHTEYIKLNNPEIMVVYVEERNVAGPILKELYESTGRKYVSFMHGEYLLRLIQGYMGFTEYYIWHEDYEQMFSQILHCDIGKYVLYKPKKLTKKWNLDEKVPSYYCTYYFSAESKESIYKLGEIFSALENKGKKCKVRPHPRYSQLEIIMQVFGKEQIEDPKTVSIEQSLGNTQFVVGLTTTVLAEAYYEGKEVVVDNITSPNKYNNLEKRHFVVLKRPHRLLSELLEDVGVDI